LGFEPRGVRYYTYEVSLTEDSYQVKASGNIDSDPDLDVWVLDGKTLKIENVHNDV